MRGKKEWHKQEVGREGKEELGAEKHRAEEIGCLVLHGSKSIAAD